MTHLLRKRSRRTERKLKEEKRMEIRKPKTKPPPARQETIPGEDLSKLSIQEMIQLIHDILQEIEIRAMENAE